MPVTANLTGHISTAIQSLDESITKMAKELAENVKLADIIILQLKAIFVKERAKFEIPPEPIPGQLNLPALQLKTRSIKVATSSAGSGDMYEHPRKLDYANPIETIYVAHGTGYYMRFATRDGDVGQQQLPYYAIPFAVSLKPGTEYAKIQVWYGGYI